MKKIIILVTISFLLVKCASIEKHNSSIDNLISVENLKSDIEFAYKKLNKLQPRLDWYIAKPKLDFKFDSIKNSIKTPMTSYQLYQNLSQVTNAIGQGHLYYFPKVKKYSKKETAAIAKKGVSVFSQFDFEIFDDKMYVVKNKSSNKNIQIGTEIVSIDGQKMTDLLKKYNNYFTSDGYNKTLKNFGVIKRFSTYYTNENGIKDSIKLELINNNSYRFEVIKRRVLDSAKTNLKKEVVAKEILKAKKLNNRVLGYDKETKLFMRKLSFVGKDSSVAIIKIIGFKNGDYSECYKQFFKKIKNYKSTKLIIDLRNNGGGRLNEISNLYSYLSEKDYIFSKPTQVKSRTSMLQDNYFKGSPIWMKPILVIAAPIYYPIVYFKTTKASDGNYYFKSNKTKVQKIAKDNFKGKVLVLINGGSFSASSIISSNLQGSKRAFFVGQETGGAYNGTVAGRMPLIKIPNSDIKMRVGLMSCIPFYNNGVEGRGIFPDKEIIPTLNDRVNNIDPELLWAIEN